MLRHLITAILFVLLVFVSYQVYKLYQQRLAVQEEFKKLADQWARYDTDNRGLLADITYFKKSDNLQKEARARLNYASLGEKMIIVIP